MDSVINALLKVANANTGVVAGIPTIRRRSTAPIEG
jgi:hypothetical protein